jgi:hypothetical protein
MGGPAKRGAPFKERRRPCALRSGAGLSFPGNHLRHPPFPAIFTWDNRLDRLGKGSASAASSKLWDQLFRLPLSAVGRVHLTPTGNRVEKRAGLQDLHQKPATVCRCLAPAKPGAIREMPVRYNADQKAYQPEPEMAFWPIEALEPLWRPSSFTLIQGGLVSQGEPSGLPARPTPEARPCSTRG